MSREIIIAAALSAISSGQAQVLEDAVSSAVDQSAQEQKASDGTLTQADLDAAVADVQAKLDAANAQIAQDKADLDSAHSDADSKLAALQVSLDAMTAKEQLEEAAVADVNSKIDQVQASFDAIRALFKPA